MDRQEAAGDNRKDTQDGGEEDYQPDIRLVQRVPPCAWINKHIYTQMPIY